MKEKAVRNAYFAGYKDGREIATFEELLDSYKEDFWRIAPDGKPELGFYMLYDQKAEKLFRSKIFLGKISAIRMSPSFIQKPGLIFGFCHTHFSIGIPSAKDIVAVGRERLLITPIITRELGVRVTVYYWKPDFFGEMSSYKLNYEGNPSPLQLKRFTLSAKKTVYR